MNFPYMNLHIFISQKYTYFVCVNAYLNWERRFLGNEVATFIIFKIK